MIKTGVQFPKFDRRKVETEQDYQKFADAVVRRINDDATRLNGALANIQAASGNQTIFIGGSFATGFRINEDGQLEGKFKPIAGSEINGTFIDDTSIISRKITNQAKGFTLTPNIFTATDYNTVTWSSSTLTLADNTAYGINSGTTGNMTGLTFLYFDKDVSKTDFQLTTSFADLAGENTILICTMKPASSSSAYAYFAPAIGVFGITDINIQANSITAAMIQANVITADKLNVTTLDAITANMGTLTAGIIKLGAAGSYLSFGATPPTSATVGTGLYIDYTGLYGLKTNDQVFVLNAVTGALTLGSTTNPATLTAGTIGAVDVTLSGGLDVGRFGGSSIELRLGYTSGITWNVARIKQIGGFSGDKTLSIPAVDGTFITTGNLTSITTVGTISSGTWQGTAVGDTYISSSSNWNTAYTDRLKWDGGSTGLNASTGRTSLGLGALATLSTVGTSQIDDGSVTTAKMAPGAVTAVLYMATTTYIEFVNGIAIDYA